jgi:hypothetical protein
MHMYARAKSAGMCSLMPRRVCTPLADVRIDRSRPLNLIGVPDTLGVAVATCAMCGRPVSEHNRHVRFSLPDPALALAEREATPGTWMSHATARESVMMQIPNVGTFVRALLPVRLSGGDSVTFGVWLAIDPRHDALRKLATVWWNDDEYRDLKIEGWLANAIAPWGMFAAPVTATVREVQQTPYCTESSNETLKHVIADEWDHDLVLAAIPRD